MNQESITLKDKPAADAGKSGIEIPESVRILIVDDEAPMRELCRRALADAGVTVETASGPEEALVLLRSDAFDIIITDMQMSDPRAGANLTEEVRSRWPQTDILIMTGQPSLETAISTLKTGAADYLIKPFSMPQLQTVVSKLLGMRRFRRELKHQKLLYQKLAEDYAVLQKLERLKSGLIGRVSHELRTPVTIVRLSAEAIKDEISPSGLPLYTILDSALDRMQATVEDLLLFTKTQDEDFQITKTAVDLGPSLVRLLADYRPLCEERELQVKINLEGERRSLLADAELMKAAFSRLLLNTINFNRKGGSISVLVRYEPEQIAFIFADTGEGIPPQEQSLIFDGLYQVGDYITRKVGGLGVGLAIVRRIVEAHGGSVTVKSVPGTGSIFTILLPQKA
ncbi:MAG: response regulator [Elusimicrobiota bacterium]|nr:response regulator [Elusimicrobiota bacterium]